MTNVIYQSFAWSKDRKFICVISKQVAPHVRDVKQEPTKTGEEPLAAEYLVLAQISVAMKSLTKHGRILGKGRHLMQLHCATCKAGASLCYNQPALCHTQPYEEATEGTRRPRKTAMDYAMTRTIIVHCVILGRISGPPI